MPARRMTCPECDAPIRLSSDHPAGKKVRCPECDALVRPPADDADDAPVRRSSRRDDADDRPRRSGSRGKKKATKNNAALIGISIVAFVLLAAGGAVAFVVMSKDRKEDPVVADAGSPGGPKAKLQPATPTAAGPPR